MKNKKENNSNDVATVPVQETRKKEITQSKQSKRNMRTLLLYGFIIFMTVLIVWQNVCDRNGLWASPAYFEERLLVYANYFWQQVGKAIAHISSFVEWLDIAQLWQSVVRVLLPAVQIAMSWTYVITGYLWVAGTYYNHPLAIYSGTALLAAVLCAVIYHFRAAILKCVPALSLQSDNDIMIVSCVATITLFFLVGFATFSYYRPPVSL